MTEYDTHEHDVLVIGAGGAGLRAAIAASAAGAEVAVICKTLLGKAHTVMAEGGVAAAMGGVDARDNWKAHFADTMRGGQYMNNWRMAELHAREAPDRVNELEAWGAVFDRTSDGRILQRHFGGHRYPRLAHLGDRTGLEILRTLQDHGVHQGVDVFMEYTILAVLTDGNTVAGVFGYDRASGRFHVFKAAAAVIATGGIGKAYKVSSNSWECTGDGMALAYHAGADLVGMEFIQFHPTGMVWPLSVHGLLVTEGVRGEGGVLLNNQGRRFMFDDVPEMYRHQTAETEAEGWRYVEGDNDARRPPELLTRDHVARCIVREIREGRGTPNGGVLLDIAWIRQKISNHAAHIQRKLPSMYRQFKDLAGVDITVEPMEVAPTTHYTMGGILVDSDTQMSTVPGLFAAGECAGGLHGANRLGGNSLSDLLVFGKRAGEHAAAKANQGRPDQPDPAQIDQAIGRAMAPLGRDDDAKVSPYEIHHELQELMQEHVGIVRTEQRLARALDGIRKLRQRTRHVSVSPRRDYNPAWHAALDLDSLLTVAEAVTRAATDRTESRGAHYRDDHPRKDDALSPNNTVLREGPDGAMQLSRHALAPMRDDLSAIIEEHG